MGVRNVETSEPNLVAGECTGGGDTDDFCAVVRRYWKLAPVELAARWIAPVICEAWLAPIVSIAIGYPN